MADVLLDSDVVIWHLRGRAAVVKHLAMLAQGLRLGVSAVSRAEVLVGMRPNEREATFGFLNACETLPVTAAVADRAAELLRSQRGQGVTISLPDGLIGATALEAGVPLHTCNQRHYPFDGLLVRAVPVEHSEET